MLTNDRFISIYDVEKICQTVISQYPGARGAHMCVHLLEAEIAGLLGHRRPAGSCRITPLADIIREISREDSQPCHSDTSVAP